MSENFVDKIVRSLNNLVDEIAKLTEAQKELKKRFILYMWITWQQFNPACSHQIYGIKMVKNGSRKSNGF